MKEIDPKTHALLLKLRKGATASFNITQLAACLDAVGWQLQTEKYDYNPRETAKITVFTPAGKSFSEHKENGYRRITMYDTFRWLKAEGLIEAVCARLGMPTVEEEKARRPPPVILTSIGASATITATLNRLDAIKVEICPGHFEYVERKNEKTGKTETVAVYFLDWPEGTKHNTSPHAHSGNAMIGMPCHACGHSIRNPFNYYPLILTAKDGTPKSLWVGADCAATLFGVKLKGVLEIDPKSAEGTR